VTHSFCKFEQQLLHYLGFELAEELEGGNVGRRFGKAESHQHQLHMLGSVTLVLQIQHYLNCIIILTFDFCLNTLEMIKADLTNKN